MFFERSDFGENAAAVCAVYVLHLSTPSPFPQRVHNLVGVSPPARPGETPILRHDGNLPARASLVIKQLCHST